MIYYKKPQEIHIRVCKFIVEILKFFVNYFDVLCKVSFKDYLCEDVHSKWPKAVRGYAV